MKDELIQFETAKLAKEKGFNLEVDFAFREVLRNNEKVVFNYEDVFCDYNNEKYSGNINTPVGYRNENYCFTCSRPTQSLLQKWLRETYKLIVLIDWEGSDGFYYKINYNIHYNPSGTNQKTYEECLELGLQEGLKLI